MCHDHGGFIGLCYGHSRIGIGGNGGTVQNDLNGIGRIGRDDHVARKFAGESVGAGTRNSNNYLAIGLIYGHGVRVCPRCVCGVSVQRDIRDIGFLVIGIGFVVMGSVFQLASAIATAVDAVAVLSAEESLQALSVKALARATLRNAAEFLAPREVQFPEENL